MSPELKSPRSQSRHGVDNRVPQDRLRRAEVGEVVSQLGRRKGQAHCTTGVDPPGGAV
jgi:hypothetical protein